MYLGKSSAVVSTDLTLSGDGSGANPLKIAKQNASVGQALLWNGSTWYPGTVSAILSYVPPYLTLNSTPSVDIASFISSDTPNLLTIGTDSEFKVQIYKDSTLSGDGTQASPLKIAQQGASIGDVLKWTGTTWFPDNTPISAALEDLTDVTITTPSTGQALVYNGTSWENSNVSTVPAGVGAGQLLYWNGSAWTPCISRKHTQQINVGNTATLPELPITSLPIDVYVNGILKEDGQDYTLSLTTITFSLSFSTNDKVTIKYYA